MMKESLKKRKNKKERGQKKKKNCRNQWDNWLNYALIPYQNASPSRTRTEKDKKEERKKDLVNMLA